MQSLRSVAGNRGDGAGKEKAAQPDAARSSGQPEHTTVHQGKTVKESGSPGVSGPREVPALLNNMTAKKWAEIALEDARKQSAAGNITRAFIIASQALVVITHHGNQIPPTAQYSARDGGSVLAMGEVSK